jgi:predicted DNA-binding transcriptional regulator AlpA
MNAPENHLGFEVLLTPEDLVKILGLKKPAQIYELIRPTARNPLPCVKVGKYCRFAPSAVREWLAANTSPTSTAKRASK